MLYVFLSHLGRHALAEAEALAPLIGSTPYEARLMLAGGFPSIVLRTQSEGRAADLAGLLRGRGHGAHVFNDENFVESAAMTNIDDFTLDGEGMRLTLNGALLPFGDVYAILRAVHESSSVIEREANLAADRTMNTNAPRIVIKRSQPREQVAYFFRRSGERPWLLRERHTSYVGLGDERATVAFPNFTRLVFRVREASPMAVFDDRLVRRRVPERLDAGGVQSSRDGVDLLAHLLAMTIASQGGSPYR